MGERKRTSDVEVREWMDDNGFIWRNKKSMVVWRKITSEFRRWGHDGFWFWALGVRNTVGVPRRKKGKPLKLVFGHPPRVNRKQPKGVWKAFSTVDLGKVNDLHRNLLDGYQRLMWHFVVSVDAIKAYNMAYFQGQQILLQ